MMEAQEFGTAEARRAIAAEQRAEAAERELARLNGKKSDGPAQEAITKDGEPKPEDFKTVGEYAKACTKYEVAQAATEARSNANEARQKAQATEQANAFAKLQDEFKAATPDYQEVVGETETILHEVGVQYIVESDKGPQLAYHIAKNPDVANRLAKLPPIRLIAELGKLEAKFDKPAEPKPQASNGVSRAPAPIQPLDGKTTPVTKDPATMNFQELRAYRQEQQRAKSR
jgi:hypothetical protein